jgi:hypothetical protein
VTPGNRQLTRSQTILKTHTAIGLSINAPLLDGNSLPVWSTLAGIGSLPSTNITISSTDHNLSVIPAAIAGVSLRAL